MRQKEKKLCRDRENAGVGYTGGVLGVIFSGTVYDIVLVSEGIFEQTSLVDARMQPSHVVERRWESDAAAPLVDPVTREGQ